MREAENQDVKEGERKLRKTRSTRVCYQVMIILEIEQQTESARRKH